jgi:hypothetical protein
MSWAFVTAFRNRTLSPDGEFEVLLKDGSHPRVSRSYRNSMAKRLGQKLSPRLNLTT